MVGDSRVAHELGHVYGAALNISLFISSHKDATIQDCSYHGEDGAYFARQAMIWENKYRNINK